MAIKLIAFDAGWVLFRPGNWEILHKYGFTDDEGYWLLREGLGRTSDWIRFQLQKGKTSRQIIKILKQYYPQHVALLDRVCPILKDVVPVDFLDMIQLGYELQKSGYLVEIWSDNGLGGPKQKTWQDSNIGLIPELKPTCALYKKYPSIHKELKVGAVYSRDIGVLKRDVVFFEKALKKHKGLKPEDVVFIEDRPSNIESAKHLGIRCIQFIAKTNHREKVDGVPVARSVREIRRLLNKLLDSD